MSKKFVLCIVVVVLMIGTLAIIANLTAQERGRGPFMRNRTDTFLKSSPLPKDEAEMKILSVLEDMYENQSRGMSNVPPEDGRLLRLLVEATNAKHVVELY